jgi:hypothetical protein
MGNATIADLLPQESTSPDDAHEIGSVEAQLPVHAIRIEEDGDQYIYGDEHPIYVTCNWRILDYGDRDAPQRYRWWRLEIKANIRDTHNHIKPGHDLIVAEHPYANGWVDQAPFKKAMRLQKDKRPEPFKPGIDSPERLINWLSDLTYDYWERGNYLTAGLDEPAIPSNPGDLRNVNKARLWVFGFCSDSHTIRDSLANAPTVSKLLDQTQTRRISFGHADERPTMHDEVIEDSSALMDLSIRQALAGPHECSAEWTGRPVLAKIDRIYREHLNNRNKVIVRRHGKQRPLFDER